MTQMLEGKSTKCWEKGAEKSGLLEKLGTTAGRRRDKCERTGTPSGEKERVWPVRCLIELGSGGKKQSAKASVVRK